MIQVQKMNKQLLLELITSNKKFFVLVFCVIFGVVAGESYSILKFPEKPKFKKILPKFIVALFVCSICTPIIEHFPWLNSREFYPYYILSVSIVAMPVLDWFINTFIPAVLSVLKTTAINILTKSDPKVKKDGTE